METILDKLMSLYPDVGESILVHVADIALYYQEGTPAHTWLDEQLEAKQAEGKPAKLAVFMAAFCTQFDVQVKVVVGAARNQNWSVDPLVNQTISFNANSLEEARAKLLTVAACYHPANFAVSSDNFAIKNIAKDKAEAEARRKSDDDGGRNFGKSGTKKATGE